MGVVDTGDADTDETAALLGPGFVGEVVECVNIDEAGYIRRTKSLRGGPDVLACLATFDKGSYAVCGSAPGRVPEESTGSDSPAPLGV